MPLSPDTLQIDVGDTQLGCVRWRGRPGAPVVVAVHGITANAWSWSAVARHLDGEMSLVAIDLRGRGTSHAAPPPFGIRSHADDVAAVIDRLGAAPAVLVGHSMGAHVALMTAERHPSAVGRVVLVDGGTPVPQAPDDVDLHQALEAMLGPSLARLGKVWPDRVTYHEMWRTHPAFVGALTPEIERYVLSDLEPCEGGFRSVVNEQAVRQDGAELINDAEVRRLFDRRAEPVTVIRAETGLLAVPPPFVEDDFVSRYPQHDWRLLRGSNHFTVLIGETGAAMIADSLREAAQALV
jgi:pimeloyl-ACP methyl ester carboxylesterase